MSGRRVHWLACWCVVLLAAVAAQASSHVRIVRLSYVDGKVQMDRANGQGLERAILNAPIVEGSRIVTGSDGLAEVEFEDNSVVRLGEATDVVFSRLLLNDDGDKVNEVELVRGTMYFDTRSSKHDIDRVIAAKRTFVVRHDSQIRFMMIGDQVQVAALTGEAQFENNGQFARIAKNQSVTVDSTNPAGLVLAKSVDSIPLDRWNKERADYQTVYSYNNFGAGSKSMSGSGFADLAYYGGFLSLPGYGLAWQPYGASNWIGWDPYMSGNWMFTSGLGYTWASAFPWGWMPSHYGSWFYVPAGGWYWCPGNSFKNGGAVTNWQPVAPVVNGPPGYTAPTPPLVPANGPHPAILVGRIGNSPAYLPGGPVPPNFRSVIQDHSGLTGLNARSSYIGNTSTYGASHNSRAVSPSHANAAQNGHVFAIPQYSGLMNGGTGFQGWSGGMGNSGHQSTGSMHNGTGGAHTGGSAASHGGSSSSPK